MEFLAGLFQIVLDLAQSESVVGRLIPIGFAVDGMELEAELVSLVLPIRTRSDGEASQGQLPKPREPNELRAAELEPKPERDTVMARAGVAMLPRFPVTVPGWRLTVSPFGLM